MAEQLLTDRDMLEGLFVELAVELAASGGIADVVMVGGSWMLWHTRRAATLDVDSAKRLDPAIESAVRAVAERHDLTARWLNDAAAPFWPTGYDLEAATVVFATASLTVRVPSAEVVFLMKMYRGNENDRDDLVQLWSMCSFPDVAASYRAFRSAYPHAPDDEHLPEWLAEIAREADGA